MSRVLLISTLALALILPALFFAKTDSTAIADEGGAEFVSQRGCKKCHFKQAKSWKGTLHAKALDILKPGERAEAKTKAGLDPAKDYTKDVTCLACHTTGYGKPGGYPEPKDAWSKAEAKLAKNNAGVGCEACHGAGSKYGPYKGDNEEYKHADVIPLGMKVPVTADNCTGCHKKAENPTADQSPDVPYVFDFETAKNDAKAVHEHLPLKFDHK